MTRSKQNKKRKNKKKVSRNRRGWIFPLVLIMTFAASTAASYYYFHELFEFESSYVPGMGQDNLQGGNYQKIEPARLYETKYGDTAAGEGAVLRKDDILVTAESVIREYVKSRRVRLLDLYIDKKGIIYVDFGDELKRNFRGDAFEELSLIAGLYNSIRAVIPGFKSLKILIEGKETESLGGHINILKPLGEEIAEGV
jgi:hypothetical protein